MREEDEKNKIHNRLYVIWNRDRHTNGYMPSTQCPTLIIKISSRFFGAVIIDFVVFIHRLIVEFIDFYWWEIKCLMKLCYQIAIITIDCALCTYTHESIVIVHSKIKDFSFLALPLLQVQAEAQNETCQEDQIRKIPFANINKCWISDNEW